MYRTTYLYVTSNPQLTLLAEFLAAMANANEEATLRVLKKATIICEPGLIRVNGPTGSLQIANERNPPVGDAPSEGREAALLAIFDRIKVHGGQ